MTASITCPRCGKTSYHPRDVQERYCGACHQFHEFMKAMTKEPLPDQITIGQKYEPAMKITDQADADAYFERCVEHCMRLLAREGETAASELRAKAENIERQNLGYFAGYYDAATRARVERLFQCAHPFFGAIAERGAPTADEAFELGKRVGAETKESR